ncbi:MAG: carboxypeptidase regulatory-like domain-containing protein [Bacteroidales bacterium]|nr:carboxypeptidase regulatory-like domain-containing protein [Bacteroidales bacterium]
MKFKEVFKSFNFTFGTLIQKTDDLISSAVRDLVELLKYGLTQETINSTQATRDEFVEMPTDAELVGDKIAVTEAKTTKAEEVREAIKDIENRVGLKYGKKSSQRRKVNAGDLSHLNDAELCRTGYSTVRIATAFIDEQGTMGLTQELIEKLKAATQEFDDLIDQQQDAIKERDISTQERRMKANELYEKIILISDTGKAAFFGKDEARYNDYVIYNTPSGTPIAEGFGMLTGIIKGENDILLEGAIIKIHDGELETTSVANGEYILDNIPVGTYTFIASAEGYQNSVVSNIEIKNGETKEVDFGLLGIEE